MKAMIEWFKKKRNIAFVVCVIVSIIKISVGGTRLYGLLEKGFSVFSVKASITKLVIDVLLVLVGLLLILISYRIKWMYESKLLLERNHQEFEELIALLKKENV